MRTLLNKVTVPALALGALCVGLALPTTASADQVDSVQLQVCNNNPRPMRFFVVGYNQFHDWTGSRFWDVPANNCTTAWDYWWQTDRSVEFHYERSDIGWHTKFVYVPRQHDGGTWTYSTN
ncbi:hypothetical protein [Streptomyces acidiscabies]|uniref:hypothetical protein n=1 Tax=Streptomyces acidiscabies TaxID=42234 RepID=UPI0038F81ADD